MIYKGKSLEYLQLEKIHSNNCYSQTETLENPLTFLWFETNNNSITIDNIEINPLANQIICLTEFHKVDISKVCNAKMLRFNRPFYCVVDHDSEVGCKGILFFGASQLPIFSIPNEELETFQTVWKMFEIEIQSNDELQQEMLQSMLKRFIILCTRIYKSSHNYDKLENNKTDIIREYNFLVEQHFKTNHTVAEYAAMLHKSPKTLSNLFSKLSHKSPLQYIQDRKMLEARRLLTYTSKSIKEIAYEIGFEDLQTFGRFFKKKQGISPTEFKEKK
ncbi:AraC family transcriptional regulator [Aquimarina sp. AU474]|uniref:helix-turn-helix domain-containing protein n=1 Tax=Aquimarina sp. AU474 TaxID=2108529 RepID=UPI000D69434A|nr:AraC family transcriptional regulator [Aquimarina sp. AU474]